MSMIDTSFDISIREIQIGDTLRVKRVRASNGEMGFEISRLDGTSNSVYVKAIEVDALFKVLTNWPRELKA